MALSPLRPSLLLLLSFVAACATEAPEDSADDDTGSAPDSGDDTADSAGDTAEVRTPPSGCTLTAMSPLTVASTERTEVTWTLACEELGDALTGAWTASLPGLNDAPVTASLAGEALQLRATVGGRVTLGRTAAAFQFDGAELLELPVRVHQPADVAVEQLRLQSPTWNAVDATPQEVSDGPLLLDTDGDGTLDTLAGFGLDAKGQPTVSVAGLGTGTWTSSAGDAAYDAGKETPDQRVSSVAWDGTTLVGATALRVGDRTDLVVQSWDAGTDKYSSQIIVNPIHTSGEPIDVNPLFEGGATLLAASGGGFAWWDGTTVHTQANLAGVTGDEALSGLAAVGLLPEVNPLAEGAPAAAELMAWVLDGRSVPKGGELELSVVSPATGARYRRVTVGALDFTPDALAAAPFDLDEDGSMDLVVEAWGGGRHAAFWVANAADKAESRAPVALELPADGPVRWSSADGRPVAVRSSFTLGGGALVSEELRHAPAALVHVAQVWAVSDVVAGSGALRKSHRVKQSEWRNQDPCLEDDGGGLLCGQTNHLRPVAGTGTGAASATDPELKVGDLVGVSPGVGGLQTVLTRATSLDERDPAELVAVDPDTCEPAMLLRDGGGGTLTVNGGSVVLTGESTLTISGGSFYLSSGFGGLDCSGECALHVGGERAIAGTWSFDDAMSQDFRVIGSGGDGEPIVSWTDPEGVGWVGLMDEDALDAGSLKGRGPIQLTGRANYLSLRAPLTGDPPPASSFTTGATYAGAGPWVAAVRPSGGGAHGCALVSTLTDLGAPEASPTELATGEKEDCSDLFVPIGELRGVPGAEGALLSARPGALRVDVLAGGQLFHGPELADARVGDFDVAGGGSNHVRVAGGDLDGNGIEDVLVDFGGGTLALLADGAGGFTFFEPGGDLANTRGPAGAGPALGTCLDLEGGTPSWAADEYLHDERNP